ncbi:Receptor protein kinase-like protein [Quillaja saponaria]|uniref:non-specific serine/threonine protein kinase n=1 Tax=Quillaja saponaria TaxID=32244 RepID=A0AAD7LWN2_QUISA|nr:Receptor protein kinase-like protein [Quillaja saponaria]
MVSSFANSISNLLLPFWGFLPVFFFHVLVLLHSFQISASVLFHTTHAPFASVFQVTNEVSANGREANALVKWKHSFDNQSQGLLSSWSHGSTTPCNWVGILCSESKSVTHINLGHFGLRGTLDGLNFSSFPNLNTINVSHNSFYGNIPRQIGELRKLQTLDLAYNKLSGGFPKSIGDLSRLSFLSFAVNNLSGSIPSEISQLTSLLQVELHDNGFSGSIPREIGTLRNLLIINLNNCKLTGLIPTSIGNLTNLVYLNLANNQLSNYIPREIGMLGNIQRLFLSKNSLSGFIPKEIGMLRNLSELDLSQNHISGRIPSTIGNLTELANLVLSMNNLSGSIPSTIGNLVKLTTLRLCTNRLSGTIPPEINNLTHLISLHLVYNSFHGHLPTQICLGRSLTNLTVAGNHFSGPVPASLKNCSSLIRVRLEDNQLTGNITDDFGVYPNLDYIDLSNNKLCGKLSPTWSRCHKLTSFKISNNNLSGSMPPELGEATQLFVLHLASNHLTGEIPKELGRLASLIELQISGNHLSGKVPLEFGLLEDLTLLDLAANNLSGIIPKQLGGLVKLLHLNLSRNQFEQSIPSEIGYMISLQNLNLAGNSLIGRIPASLGQLQRLETLNLSHNNLYGSLPSTFDGLLSLTYVDISYNQLEGSLPNIMAFHNATIEALRNNKGLCSNISGLVACPKIISDHPEGQRRKNVTLIVLFPIFGTLIVMFLVVGILYMVYQSASKTENQPQEEPIQNLFAVWSYDGKIVYENIVRATEDFDSRYCIGVGRCGSVYRAELQTGQVVAVKKFHSETDGKMSSIMKSFTAEIQTLTKIRHRNIVKLFGFCSHAQHCFLVYEYFEGGSLDMILKSMEKAIALDWHRRINIIKGVANALYYMHHNCSPPIIHRDISSKNILLNLDYEANLSDFGTTKILNPDSSNLTSFAGTFGYSAPELAYTLEANEKCDVYSYGVLTLEVVLGQHPGDLISSLFSPYSSSVCSTARNLLLKDVLDQRLSLPTYPFAEEVISVAKLALACLNESPRSRPSMEQVCEELSIPSLASSIQLNMITLGDLLI